MQKRLEFLNIKNNSLNTKHNIHELSRSKTAKGR